MPIDSVLRTAKPSGLAGLAVLCLLAACSPRHNDTAARAGQTEPGQADVQAQPVPAQAPIRASAGTAASTPPLADATPRTRLALGEAMKPFGPNPEPGQVQWPSNDTPPPAAVATGSPFNR